MSTPTIKVVHKLTQEERLKEAVITEKKNIESLNVFYQQEEDRKKSRRAALLAKRVPMTSFIRYVSKTTYFDPIIPPLIQEIPPEQPKQTKREHKRKKEPKNKNTAASNLNSSENQVIPSSVNSKPEDFQPQQKQATEPQIQQTEQETDHQIPDSVDISVSESITHSIPHHSSVSLDSVPVSSIQHHGISASMEVDPLSHSTISMTSAIPIDPSIHAHHSHPDTPLSVDPISDHAQSVQSSPPSHLVISPSSSNPMLGSHGPLSPVGMTFSTQNDPYRRSTSVEQLEADYINFHVAEEPDNIDDPSTLHIEANDVLGHSHGLDTTHELKDLGLDKSNQLHSNSLSEHGHISNPTSTEQSLMVDHCATSLDSKMAVGVGTGMPTSILGTTTTSPFPMSDMVMPDVGDHKHGELQHKQDLHVTVQVPVHQDQNEPIIIPATYSTTSSVLTTSSHPSIDVNHSSHESAQLIHVTASHPTSMNMMKTHYGDTVNDSVMLNTQDAMMPPTSETQHDGAVGPPSESIANLTHVETSVQVPSISAAEQEAISQIHDLTEDQEPPSYIIQGPRACRAVTTISLMEFPENFHYTTSDIQKVLFGTQALDIPILPPERIPVSTNPAAIPGSGPGRKKRGPAEKNKEKESTLASSGEKGANGKTVTDAVSEKESGVSSKKHRNDTTSDINAATNAANSKTGSRLKGAAANLASLTANPLLSRGFGMKVGGGGLGVSGASVGPLGTGVIGSSGGGPGGLSAAAANAAAAAAAAAAANGGLSGGSAAARAKSAAALAALQAAPKCVVTGKPCKFVDPKSGLPYSTMEAFQMIRTVVNCEVPWNMDFGIFMGPLGKEARHAKGVPPGFGGPV